MKMINNVTKVTEIIDICNQIVTASQYVNFILTLQSYRNIVYTILNKNIPFIDSTIKHFCNVVTFCMPDADLNRTFSLHFVCNCTNIFHDSHDLLSA